MDKIFKKIAEELNIRESQVEAIHRTVSCLVRDSRVIEPTHELKESGRPTMVCRPPFPRFRLTCLGGDKDAGSSKVVGRTPPCTAGFHSLGYTARRGF